MEYTPHSAPTIPDGDEADRIRCVRTAGDVLQVVYVPKASLSDLAHMKIPAYAPGLCMLLQRVEAEDAIRLHIQRADNIGQWLETTEANWTQAYLVLPGLVADHEGPLATLQWLCAVFAYGGGQHVVRNLANIARPFMHAQDEERGLILFGVMRDLMAALGMQAFKVPILRSGESPEMQSIPMSNAAPAIPAVTHKGPAVRRGIHARVDTAITGQPSDKTYLDQLH